MAISRITKGMEVKISSWIDKSVPAGDWAIMKTITIPANTKALILGWTNNNQSAQIMNTCNITCASGTPYTQAGAGTVSNSGAGNSAIGWLYIHANTECKVNIRQYGYTGALSTMRGECAAITLEGRTATIT